DAVGMASRVRRLLDRVAAFPVPVIAALNGHALGGGAELAIAADVRIAADDIKIGFNQVSLGIMPAWGGAERLAQVVGRGRALVAIATVPVSDAEAPHRLGDPDVNEPAWRERAVSRSLTAARSRAEERVQRFLDAAFALIDEKGTTDFTIQEVIDRSNQSLRAFYQHFNGKDELLLALFEETV